MLIDVERIQAMPGLSNLAAVPIAWLNTLLGAADRAIKQYLKRDIELTAYVEYYSGNTQRDIILRQFPVLYGATTIASASNGASLPQATINVASTTGFHPGLAGDTSLTPPTLAIQTGTNTYTTVTYTGTTATTFTGCTGGTGTLSSTAGLNAVFSPVVFYDPGGYYGQAPSAFAANTLMVQGTQYVTMLDSGGTTSHRGLIRRIGGAGAGFVGFYPESMYSGKLGAYRMPTWPRGDGNIKVCYNAGYANGKVPQDIQIACAMLVAYMVRNLPNGAPLASESLGQYSYQVLQASTDIPELGSLPKLLSGYREVSW